MAQAFNITISVPSGDPDKLRIIEKTNRLSLALVFNREELADVIKARDELSYTGVYMLVNSSSESLPEIYIGEGESVLTRLRSHSSDTKKEFWEWCVVFVNRDNSLYKGHIQHLEASLVERATRNKRSIVKNDVLPKKPSLPESVLFEAEDLLNDIYQVVPLLGISAFEMVPDVATVQPEHILSITTKGITATANQNGSKITVLKNSQAIKEHAPSISSSFRSLRETLVAQGVLADQGGHYTFTQDYTFSSPSTAAMVVMGRNANGRTEWRTPTGETLKQLQQQAME